jgi:hypothetical protein
VAAIRRDARGTPDYITGDQVTGRGLGQCSGMTPSLVTKFGRTAIFRCSTHVGVKASIGYAHYSAGCRLCALRAHARGGVLSRVLRRRRKSARRRQRRRWSDLSRPWRTASGLQHHQAAAATASAHCRGENRPSGTKCFPPCQRRSSRKWGDTAPSRRIGRLLRVGVPKSSLRTRLRSLQRAGAFRGPDGTSRG